MLNRLFFKKYKSCPLRVLQRFSKTNGSAGCHSSKILIDLLINHVYSCLLLRDLHSNISSQQLSVLHGAFNLQRLGSKLATFVRLRTSQFRILSRTKTERFDYCSTSATQLCDQASVTSGQNISSPS